MCVCVCVCVCVHACTRSCMSVDRLRTHTHAKRSRLCPESGVKRRQEPVRAARITGDFLEEAMFATPASLKAKPSGS